MTRERKIYDASFKTTAVELSNERTNISELKREFVIKGSILYKWRKEYQQFGKGSFPVNGKLKITPEHEKIQELKKKLKATDLERYILKKAIDIFSKNGR